MTLVKTTRTLHAPDSFPVVVADDEIVRAMLRRGLFQLGVSVAGAGILAAFAAIGAVGLVGQRCAELWPARGGRVA